MTSSSSSEPAPPPAPLSSEIPVQPPATQPLMHKNHLQEFALRSSIAAPVYQTINEGQLHAPRFRSTVWVDGMCFTSQITFSQRKAAEQEVARVALEGLSQKIRDEGYFLVCENITFCKSLLNEYAAKLNLEERPKYNTVQKEALLPAFVSSLVFNGTSYTGEAARNKKEAEQLAALAAIFSILGNSDSAIMLLQMIKSKSKFYEAFRRESLHSIYAGGVPLIANTAHTSVALDDKDKEVASLVADEPRMLSSCQEFQVPKQEPSPEATQLPNVSLQLGLAPPIDHVSCSKKRPKNKKKANKKARSESTSLTAEPENQVPPLVTAEPENQVPPSVTAEPENRVPPSVTAEPENQVPPCSVAHSDSVEV